jgi:GT2 family glycosyltransferase
VSEAPRVSVVVVNFNGGDKLQLCLKSILATTRGSEILVVDNASTDGSARLPSEIASRVQLFRNSENIGYAAALNQAAALSHGDVLVFCNMDMVAEPGWLEPLLEVLSDHPNAGAVNPLIMLEDGQHVNAAGQTIHVTGLGFNRGLGESPSRYGTEAFEVSGIQGAVFAMRRTVFDEVGGLDTAGFLYHEDVNLSWVLRLAGYRLWCAPRSRVRHAYFLSMYAQKFHLLERNRLTMILAYVRPSSRVLLMPMLLLTEALAWSYALIRRHGFVRAKWTSYTWVIRNRSDIEHRRAIGERLRRVSDFSVFRAFRFVYDWKQFGTLARERGESRRKPKAGLPINR